MPLTNILAASETVGISDQRFVGQMMTRNMRLKTSEQLTAVPFRFTMKPHSYLQYSKNRALLNELRLADRSVEQYLSFANTGWVNYISYQGGLTATQAAAVLFETTTGSISIGVNLPAGTTGISYVFKAGDYIQAGRYPYIITQDVPFTGALAIGGIQVHRPALQTLSLVTGAIGQHGTANGLNGVTFAVKLMDYPTYTLTPTYNDSFIQWNGEFVAMENIL